VKKLLTITLAFIITFGAALTPALASEEEYLVYLRESDGGSVSGGGYYAYGETVTVVATPDPGYYFEGWYDWTSPGSTKIAGAGAVYTFTLSSSVALIAHFVELTDPIAPKHPVIAYAISGGSTTGSGLYSYGETATVTATPDEGYVFVGWYDEDNKLVENADARYSFIVTSRRILKAQFMKSDSGDITPPATLPSSPTTSPPSTSEIITFPDANFEKAVRSEIGKPTGDILKRDVEKVDVLNVSEKDISDLSGIEHFIELTDLSCNGNRLVSLDISKNTKLQYLNCSYNSLTSLDISKNTLLVFLRCSDNYITTLNCRNNTLLKEIACVDNRLISLDISNNAKLVYLHCGNNLSHNGNKLTVLDTSKNTALTELYCYDNQLTMLNVSNNKELTHFNCWGNYFPNKSAIYGLNENRLQLFEYGNNKPVSSVRITQSDFISQTANGTKGFKQNIDEFSIFFDATAAIALSGKSSGDLVFCAFKAAPTDGMPAFVLTIASGGKLITDFGGGKITFEAPYILGAEESPNAIIAFQTTEDGDYAPVQGHYSAAGKSVIITFKRLSIFGIGYNPVVYTDIPVTAWYSNAVEFIAARGYTVGITGNSFEPSKLLTRGEFAANLMKAYDISPLADLSGNFPDVDANAAYAGYIAVGRVLGILQGDNGNFNPENVITRQEMFTLLYNILVAIGETPQKSSAGKSLSDFSDDTVPDWACVAIESLLQAGMIDGSSGKLEPTGSADRTHMAQMIYNLLTR